MQKLEGSRMEKRPDDGAIAALVAVVLVTALTALGGQLSSTFTSVTNSLKPAG